MPATTAISSSITSAVFPRPEPRCLTSSSDVDEMGPNCSNDGGGGGSRMLCTLCTLGELGALGDDGMRGRGGAGVRTSDLDRTALEPCSTGDGDRPVPGS